MAIALIIIQFSINPNHLPQALPDHGTHETKQGGGNGGKCVLAAERCAVGNLRDLSEHYVLTNAYNFSREVPIPGISRTKERFFARFIFVPKGVGTPAKNLKDLQGTLDELTGEAFWNIQTWVNPYTSTGAKEGSQFLSVNLNSRCPLIGGDGNPVTEWETDAEGYLVGEAPKPIQAKNTLVVVANGEEDVKLSLQSPDPTQAESTQAAE